MSKSTLENVKILENKYLGKDNYLMTVESENIKNGVINPEVGQFYMLKLNDQIRVLRRPISIHDVDKKTGKLYFMYKVLGNGTKELSEMKVGDIMNIQGPLGHGFEIKNEYEHVVVLGGGIGLAPLKYLIDELGSRRITFIAGGRDKETMNMLNSFDLNKPNIKTIICTDDGSLGKKANVIEVLKEVLASEKIDNIYSCGPQKVLDIISSIANELGVESQISMEERMACGVGACVGCSVKTKEGMKKVCKQGPVLYSKEAM